MTFGQVHAQNFGINNTDGGGIGAIGPLEHKPQEVDNRVDVTSSSGATIASPRDTSVLRWRSLGWWLWPRGLGAGLVLLLLEDVASAAALKLVVGHVWRALGQWHCRGRDQLWLRRALMVW